MRNAFIYDPVYKSNLRIIIDWVTNDTIDSIYIYIYIVSIHTYLYF